LRSASRADRVAMASRSGSASLNIKPARVGSSTSGRLSWSDVSDVPGRQVGAEIGDRCGGEWRRRRTVAFHRSVPGVWPPASQWRGTRPGPLPDVHAAAGDDGAVGVCGESVLLACFGEHTCQRARPPLSAAVFRRGATWR
jgi:hypothetical protein